MLNEYFSKDVINLIVQKLWCCVDNANNLSLIITKCHISEIPLSAMLQSATVQYEIWDKRYFKKMKNKKILEEIYNVNMNEYTPWKKYIYVTKYNDFFKDNKLLDDNFTKNVHLIFDPDITKIKYDHSYGSAKDFLFYKK